MSTKPTIKIYQERIPEHYVGADISIILKAKCEKWKVSLVESSITTILEGNDHAVESDTYPDGEILIE